MTTLRATGIAVVCGCLLLTACSGTGRFGDNRACPLVGWKTATGAAGGAFIGAGIGAAAGRDAKAALIGALAGALIGAMVGNSLDQKDCATAQAALNQALDQSQPGETKVWVNPESGNSGSFTSGGNVPQASGEICRSFERSVSDKNGHPMQNEHGNVGIACRNDKGDWVVRG